MLHYSLPSPSKLRAVFNAIFFFFKHSPWESSFLKLPRLHWAILHFQLFVILFSQAINGTCSRKLNEEGVKQFKLSFKEHFPRWHNHYIDVQRRIWLTKPFHVLILFSNLKAIDIRRAFASVPIPLRKHSIMLREKMLGNKFILKLKMKRISLHITQVLRVLRQQKCNFY